VRGSQKIFKVWMGESSMGIAESISRGLRLSSKTFDEGMVFGKKNIIGVIKYLIVSSLAMLGIGAAAGILAVIAYISVSFAFISLAPGYSGMGSVAAMAVSALIALAGVVAGYAYSLAANFGAIRFIYSGKKGGYFEPGNLEAAWKWSLFIVGAIIVLALAAIGGAYALGMSLVGPLVGVLLVVAIMGIILGGVLLMVVALYYSQQELAVNGRGPIEAIGASWNMVKGNFWETVVFGMIIYVLSEIVMGVPYFLLSLGMQAGVGLMALGPLMIAVGMAVLGICMLLLIALGLLVEAGALILKVKFYKKIAGGKREARTKIAS
jgi:hypothetical protein